MKLRQCVTNEQISKVIAGIKMAPQNEVFECPICDSSYSKRSLREHLFYKHGWTKDQISLKCNELSVIKYAGVTFECSKCQKKYGTARGLKDHEANVHAVEFLTEKREIVCVFENCGGSFSTLLEMGIHAQHQHTEELHGQAGVQERIFNNEQEVTAFLDHLREAYGTQYATYNSYGQGKLRYLRCCHSGAQSHSQKQTKRIGKIVRRTVDVCTSFAMITRHADGSLKLVATTGHSGHLVDYAKLGLTGQEKQKIVEMLKAGASSQFIQETFNGEPGCTRMHFLTHKDIRSVREELLPPQEKKHKDDLRSVFMRAEEVNERDGIHHCVAEDNNISIVIVTPSQAGYLKSYGHKGVVIDDTFSVTTYTVRLTTMIVVDDQGRGLPCGYLITNRLATLDVVPLFEVLKTIHPNFRPRFFMADAALVFWNAFIMVFPELRECSQRLICRWHVLQCWGRKAKAHMEDGSLYIPLKTDRRLLKENMRVLIRLGTPDEFQKEFLRILDWLEETEHTAYAEYLSGQYAENTNQWNSVEKHGVPFTTSTHCESWHAYLKGHLIAKKRNVRLDTLIEVLITCPDNIARRHSVQDRRGYTSKRQTANHNKHRLAMQNVESRVKRVEGGWEVLTHLTSKTPAFVTHVANCNCNGSRCRGCQSQGCPCPCSLSCTCTDKSAGISCTHSHSVALFCAGQVLPQHYEPVEDDGVVDIGDGDEFLYFTQDQHNSVSTTAIEPIPETNDDMKKDLFQEFETQMAAMRSAMLQRLKDDHYSGEGMVKINAIVKDAVARLEHANLLAITPLVKENGPNRNTKTARKEMGYNKVVVPARSNTSPDTLKKTGETEEEGRNELYDLPSSLKKRKRAREEHGGNQYCAVQATEKYHCGHCFQMDPKEFNSDASPIEWIECDACCVWYHKSCAVARSCVCGQAFQVQEEQHLSVD